VSEPNETTQELKDSKIKDLMFWPNGNRDISLSVCRILEAVGRAEML